MNSGTIIKITVNLLS